MDPSAPITPTPFQRSTPLSEVAPASGSPGIRIPPGPGVTSKAGEHPAANPPVFSFGLVARLGTRASIVDGKVHANLEQGASIPLDEEANKRFKSKPRNLPNVAKLTPHPFGDVAFDAELVVRLEDGKPAARLALPQASPALDFDTDVSRFHDTFGRSFLTVVHALLIRNESKDQVDPTRSNPAPHPKYHMSLHYYDAGHQRLFRMTTEAYLENHADPEHARQEHPPGFSTPVRITPSADGADARCFVLKDRQLVKAIGFSYSEVMHTGTSRPGLLCVTDGMNNCIAIVIAGEVAAATPEGQKARVRVFHLTTSMTNTCEVVGVHIRRMQALGLAVKAAIFGGNADNTPSMARAKELRGLCANHGVALEFDEACDKRLPFDIEDEAVIPGANTPLGGVINEDGTVSIVTRIVG